MESFDPPGNAFGGCEPERGPSDNFDFGIGLARPGEDVGVYREAVGDWLAMVTAKTPLSTLVVQPRPAGRESPTDMGTAGPSSGT